MSSIKISAFCCENSALKAVAALRGDPVLDGVEIVPVPCAGRIEISDILGRVENGADRVLVLCCPEDNCKHLRGNKRAAKRAAAAAAALQEAGYDGNAMVGVEMLSSLDTHKLSAVLERTRGAGSRPAAGAGENAGKAVKS